MTTPPRHAATDLSAAALGGPIRLHNGHFTDSHGRILSLRGLNVSGISKLPAVPNGLSHIHSGFYSTYRTVSFVGRPFPLEEADLHFRRLQAWGLPLIRLLVTWEALGHAGPDPDADLDGEYIAYVKALMALMPAYGLKCFVCAHQDVWSRFSGGSGAPAWTFEAAGLDVEAFVETGAAYVHCEDEARRAGGGADPREPTGPFQWPSGYQKLAASTMATLFWAGEAMAPKMKCWRERIDGGDGGAEQVSIQTYLQDAFIEAFGRLADEVGGLEACIGFEAMNEPHRGLVNLHDFDKWNYDTDLHISHVPSFAQALALGSGHAQEVDFWVKSWPIPSRISHRSHIDPKGRSAWLSKRPNLSSKEPPRGMGQCIWLAHGVWSWDEKNGKATISDRNYFDHDHRAGHEGEKIEWYRDCYAPFLEKLNRRVARKWQHHLSFVAPIPNEFMPPWPKSSLSPSTKIEQDYATETVISIEHTRNMVYAPHFYDLNVLFGKAHNWMSVNVQGLARKMFVLKALYFGADGLRRNYKKQIGNIHHHGKLSLGNDIPMIIGEVGISWDINKAHAYKTGDYDKQRELIHALISAMEDVGVGFTLWNYNPYNTMEYGDGWNKEDFSIINGDDVSDLGLPRADYRNAQHESDELYRGGRTLDVIIRPYAAKIAGELIYSSWDPETLRFELQYKTLTPASRDSILSAVALETAIFLPNYHYLGHKLVVCLNEGTWEYRADLQTLFITSDSSLAGKTLKLVITISDEYNHLFQRIECRRRAIGWRYPSDLLPIALQVRLRELSMVYVVAIIVILTSFLVKQAFFT